MSESQDLIDCAVGWERNAGDRRWLTQPLGEGRLQTWTWKQALDEVRRMAAYLVSLDLPTHSSIAIWSKNCAWWFMADLAVAMAGHVSVPLFPVLMADTVRYILDHSDSKLLFVGKLDPGWEEMHNGVPARLPRLAFPVSPVLDAPGWNDIVAAHQPLPAPVARAPEDLATIIYTSGSTGQPKGVMVSSGAMAAVARRLTSFLSAGVEDRVLSYLPLAHCFERAYIEAMGLYAGCQIFFAETLDTFLDDLRRARPTMFLSVPRLWIRFQAGVFEKVSPTKLAQLLKIPIVRGLVKRKILHELGLGCVRIAGSGSAPLSPEIIAWYRGLGLEMLEGYAMTEDFAYSHIGRPGHVKPGYVGPPLPDVECRLAADGEILVKSPGNMLGYFRDPEETAATFTADGFIKTGDLGSTDEEDQLTITGRVKELFKTAKGKYVAPAPIENRLLNHPAIEQCCVTGSGQTRPHAIVVLSEHACHLAADGRRPALEQGLTEYLDAVNRELATYERLEFLAVVDGPWLPENGLLTPTLKVKRCRIDEVYGPLATGWYGARKPVVWHGGAAT